MIGFLSFPEVKDWRIFRDAGLALVFPGACSQRWLHFFLAATMLQHSEPTLDSIFLVDNDNYLKKKYYFAADIIPSTNHHPAKTLKR
ncbi:MAG: hypothetical protein IKQ77_15535 [Prevotella sp.]|nr:hypothetical protein [Prevotella sp.]